MSNHNQENRDQEIDKMIPSTVEIDSEIHVDKKEVVPEEESPDMEIVIPAPSEDEIAEHRKDKLDVDKDFSKVSTRLNTRVNSLDSMLDTLGGLATETNNPVFFELIAKVSIAATKADKTLMESHALRRKVKEGQESAKVENNSKTTNVTNIKEAKIIVATTQEMMAQLQQKAKKVEVVN